ncbi:hypothetical protein JCM17380_16410 [Desulfosporosinus burensis]
MSLNQIIESYMIEMSKLDSFDEFYEERKREIEQKVECLWDDYHRSQRLMQREHEERHNEEMERRDAYFESLHYGY